MSRTIRRPKWRRTHAQQERLDEAQDQRAREDAVRQAIYDAACKRCGRLMGCNCDAGLYDISLDEDAGSEPRPRF